MKPGKPTAGPVTAKLEEAELWRGPGLDARTRHPVKHLYKIITACAWALLALPALALDPHQHVISLALSATPVPAAMGGGPNVLGTIALTTYTINTLNPVIASNLLNGTACYLIEEIGLTNLSGVNQASFNLGFISATPFVPTNNPTTFTNNPLDWWYNPQTNLVDSAGVPTNRFTAAINNRNLTASGGRWTLNPCPWSTGHWDLFGVTIAATTGSSTTPQPSTNCYPPGLRPGDSPAVSFQSLNAAGVGQGLKANITAASLASCPIPPAVLSLASGYSATNTLLDLLVSGATWMGFLTLANPTQPDQVDSTAPVLGAGPPYKFTANANKGVNRATDKNGLIIDLNAALKATAYSSYWTFTANRAIPQLSNNPWMLVSNPTNHIVVLWPSWAGWTLQNSWGNLSTWSAYVSPITDNGTNRSISFVTTHHPIGFFRLVQQ